MPTPQVFRTRREGDVLLVTVMCDVSSLAWLEYDGELNAVLASLRLEGPRHVVLDFQAVVYFDSSMLEAIVALSRRVHKLNGKLAMCGLSDFGREVLHLARFDTLWPVLDTRQAALEAVRKG